jgi:hypothetical protein
VRHRWLQLECGTVSGAQPDLIAALSELVGPRLLFGLWCLAPWDRDGHLDHVAAGGGGGGCRTYNLRLVRYLCAAWDWISHRTYCGAPCASSRCPPASGHARAPLWRSRPLFRVKIG